MSEQAEIQIPESPEKRRFQFGLKHVLAAPVLVAAFFAFKNCLGLFGVLLFMAFLALVVGLVLAKTVGEYLAAVAIFGMLLALALPGISTVGPSLIQRVQCCNKLKEIGLALGMYHDAHGSFPPAYIADEDGRPMHSWRVLILPFLEQRSLYERYDFDEPWDGPNNRKLADIPISAFNCPSNSKEPSPTTSYLAVVGPDTAWPGRESTSLGDFDDDTATTLLVVEVADSGIHWMEPRDLHVTQMSPTINPPDGQGISSPHPGGFNGAHAAFVDGHVRFLPDNTPPEQLRAMLTRSGNDR